MPTHDHLAAHINDVQASARRRYAIVRGGGQIAHGLQAEHVYLERFNLTASDVIVLGARRHARATDTTATAATAYRYYLMRVFTPGSFYNVLGLRPPFFFEAMQNKMMAGRDKEWTDAMGRPLSVAYFEMCDGEAEAPIVKRCNEDVSSLEPTAATLAELIRVVGYIAPVPLDAHVQEHEDALLKGWLAHEPVRWSRQRIVGHADV